MEKETKEINLATAVVNYWMDKKLPSSKQTTLDKQLQEFKRVAIEKLLKQKPNTINNGNIYFKDIPNTPKFPWETWTYINWENFTFLTKKEKIITNTT